MEKCEEVNLIKNLYDLPSDPKLYNWSEISKLELSDKFIIKYHKYLSWWVLSTRHKLSEKVIKRFHKKIDWEEFSLRKDIDINFLLKFPEYIIWDYVVSREDFSEELIEKYYDNLDKAKWTSISYCRTNLPLNFYKKYKDKIDWKAFFLGICEKSKKKYIYDNVNVFLTDELKEFFEKVWNEQE